MSQNEPVQCNGNQNCTLNGTTGSKASNTAPDIIAPDKESADLIAPNKDFTNLFAHDKGSPDFIVPNLFPSYQNHELQNYPAGMTSSHDNIVRWLHYTKDRDEVPSDSSDEYRSSMCSSMNDLNSSIPSCRSSVSSTASSRPRSKLRPKMTDSALGKSRLYLFLFFELPFLKQRHGTMPQSLVQWRFPNLIPESKLVSPIVNCQMKETLERLQEHLSFSGLGLGVFCASFLLNALRS